MRLFDVGAAIDLEAARQMLGRSTEAAPVEAQSAVPPTAPFPQPREVRFTPASGPPGCRIEVRLHRIGVVTVRIRWPVQSATLAALAQAGADVQVEGQSPEAYARSLVHKVREDLGPAVHEPSPGVVEERYIAYCVHAAPAEVAPTLEREATAIAQLISDAPGQALVPARLAAAAKHTLQYTPGDAVVLGWDHAVILDEPGQYEDILDVMELANLELLEFRAYDSHLDERLDASFDALDRLWRPGGLFRSARGTLRDISRLRVEFARLTDNLHDTGKVFGDWYTAQLHKRLHERFHLASWERAVDAKMETLEDMFHLAQEEANHRRSLVLEVAVIVLFVVDLVLLFQGGK